MTSTAEMEDTLKIRSWGRWAYFNVYRELGAKAPGWAMEYQPPWPDGIRNPPPPITDEEAGSLDNMICFLPEDMKRTIISIYVYRASVRSAAKVLRRSKEEIAGHRDAALNRLYGALCMQ